MFKKNLSTILSQFTKLKTELDTFITASEAEQDNIIAEKNLLEIKQKKIEGEVKQAQHVLDSLDKMLTPAL